MFEIKKVKHIRKFYWVGIGMKRFGMFLMVVLVCVMIFGCSYKNNSVVRIHIRANSNSVCDQEVKLKVRDAIIDHITPMIVSCEDAHDVKYIISQNLLSIELVANQVLINNGFNYVSCATVRNEYFPSREYSGEVFPADYYDALIIELGEGVGDNWWCVAYPPLCFVGEDVGNTSIKYKSKILELINKYLG
jgi:stage II sporulation protein R